MVWKMRKDLKTGAGVSKVLLLLAWNYDDLKEMMIQKDWIRGPPKIGLKVTYRISFSLNLKEKNNVKKFYHDIEVSIENDSYEPEN